MIPENLLKDQLLALLVMDLKYDSAPVYGHAPLRHQVAWQYATWRMTAGEVEKSIAALREQAEDESGGNG